MRKFDNQKFWNDRYKNNPKLGSGPGSRGQNAKMKRDYLDNLIAENKIETVLDYGCGDLNCLTVDAIPIYYGVDTSDVVLQKNKINFPQHKWLSSVGEIKKDLKFQLIVCNDVLIHQDTREKFDKIFNNCLELSEAYFVFTVLNSRHRAVSNVFYYDLDEIYVKSKVFSFRDVDMFIYDKRNK